MDEYTALLSDLTHQMISEFRNKYPAYLYTKSCFLLMPKFLISQIKVTAPLRYFRNSGHEPGKQGDFSIMDIPIYYNYTDSIILMHEDALLEVPGAQPIMKIEGLLKMDISINFDPGDILESYRVKISKKVTNLSPGTNGFFDFFT